MSSDLALTQSEGNLATANFLEAFAAFLPLHTADDNASPATIRTYHSHAGQLVPWCREQGINPTAGRGDDVVAYRKFLVGAGYCRPTVALKLAVVRQLYEAATWPGLREDNPAAGVKASRERTSRAHRVAILPLEGLTGLLTGSTETP